MIKNILHKQKIKTTALATAVAVFSLLPAGCGSGKDHPDGPEEPTDRKQTILLYAVASNNLYSNLVSDKDEILKGASNINLKNLSFLIYEVTPDGMPQMLELTRNAGGECEYVQIKEYDKSLYSTDPARISDVIEDVRKLRDAESYGLILWSHGTGLDPVVTDHAGHRSVNYATSASGPTTLLPEMFAFGQDIDKDKNPSYSDAINIDELADAIPDHMFDFIWFDACYMAGIEMIYELRDKCNWFVGYPTEVYDRGMPYNLTLPFLLREDPQLIHAAETFFDYYANNFSSTYRVATIAMVDMSKIESVADFCRRTYATPVQLTTDGLQKYTRGSIGPFYDFGQVTRQTAENNGLSNPDTFQQLMDSFIPYKASTPINFSFKPVDLDNFSGISCYLFSETDSTDKGKYYHNLDWYKRVYPKLD